MTLEKLFQLLYIVAIIIAIGAGLIQTIVIFRRNKGTKIPKVSSKDEKVQLTEQVKWQDFVSQMKDRILNYIGIAENAYKGMKGVIDNYGEIKLEDVLSKVRTDCLQEGVKYYEDFWRDYVEKMIGFSNTINAKEESKTEIKQEEQKDGVVKETIVR